MTNEHLKVLLCFDLQVVDQLVEEVRLLFHAVKEILVNKYLHFFIWGAPVEVIIKLGSFHPTYPFTHKLVCLWNRNEMRSSPKSQEENLVYLLCQALWQEGHPGGPI